jgi:hypothetical protein
MVLILICKFNAIMYIDDRILNTSWTILLSIMLDN